MRSTLRALLLAGGLAALAAGPALSQVVFHRGAAGDPESLDSHKTSTVVESDILLDLYEGLVTYDAKANIVPGVAERWSVAPDGLSYTFTLRADAKWSNGEPVTAADFVYSFRRLLNPATGAKYANILYTLKNGEKVNKGQLPVDALGVRAVDARTLVAELEFPAPYFIAQLAHQTGLPVHPATVEKHGKDFTRPENWVSNGAFTLRSFTPNDRLVVVRNPQYREAAATKIDQVIFYPLEDRAAALRRFQAGEIHYYNDAPADQMKFIRAELKDSFRVAPYLGTYYFVFNTAKKPFSDPRVRLALSMVIDREFLAEQIWGGTMIPAWSLVPPGIGNYDAPAEMPAKAMSVIEREDKAKALLKEAGYGPGNPLKVQIRYNTSENHKNTSVALADMWKPLGVEASLINSDLKSHYALLREKGDFDIARAGWIADYSDPQNFLFLAQGDNKGLNYASYRNDAFDALMKKAAAEADLKARAATLREAEAILMAEQPFAPLLFYSSKNLVSPKVAGFENNVLDRHLSRFLSIRP
jgi:oligopeptide transport system substrate-binding protein